MIKCCLTFLAGWKDQLRWICGNDEKRKPRNKPEEAAWCIRLSLCWFNWEGNHCEYSLDRLMDGGADVKCIFVTKACMQKQKSLIEIHVHYLNTKPKEHWWGRIWLLRRDFRHCEIWWACLLWLVVLSLFLSPFYEHCKRVHKKEDHCLLVILWRLNWWVLLMYLIHVHF